MNFCATARWMREISLTPRFRRSSGINSEAHLEGRSRRTARLFSRIMRDFVSLWVLPRLGRCLRRQRERACFRQDPCAWIPRFRDIWRHSIHYRTGLRLEMAIPESSALPGSKSRRKITSPSKSIASSQSKTASPGRICGTTPKSSSRTPLTSCWRTSYRVASSSHSMSNTSSVRGS